MRLLPFIRIKSVYDISGETMSSHITVSSWNMDGISFLKTDSRRRGALKAHITGQLKDFIHKYEPGFIAVQEIVRYEEGGVVWELVDPPDGYCYQSSISIDTKRHRRSSPC